MLKPFQLGGILVRHGALTEAQVAEALRKHQDEGIRLGEVLLRDAYCSEVAIYRALAQQLGFPFVDLEENVPPPAVLRLIPAPVALKLGLVPVRREPDGKILVVVQNPWDFNLDARIREEVRPPVTIASGVASQITRILENYSDLSRWQQQGDSSTHLDHSRLRLQESVKPAEAALEDAVNKVNAAIEEARLRGGTELRMAVEHEMMVIRAMVNGRLERLGAVPWRALEIMVRGSDRGLPTTEQPIVLSRVSLHRP